MKEQELRVVAVKVAEALCGMETHNLNNPAPTAEALIKKAEAIFQWLNKGEEQKTGRNLYDSVSHPEETDATKISAGDIFVHEPSGMKFQLVVPKEFMGAVLAGYIRKGDVRFP